MNAPSGKKPASSLERARPQLFSAAVGLVTFAAFSPALRGVFLNWDDDKTLVNNAAFRGLGWTQIKWMFGASIRYGGHYIPVTWLTYGLDYVLWGMNPRGYHLTNLVLHSASAVLFFFISRRLLLLAAPGRGEPDRAGLDLAAAVSALLFSIHPLRVGSVAWVTERRDVLSGFFYLLAVLCYLRAGAPGGEPDRRRWLAFAVVLFPLSLLSKVSGIALPLVFVVLDVYPLRRLPGDPKRWVTPETGSVWREKIPFFLMALLAGAVGIVAEKRVGTMLSLKEVGLAGRLAMSAFSSAFYLFKTALPFRLIPLYERPVPLDPFRWPFIVGGLSTIGLGVFFYRARRSFPAGLAAWAAYLLALAPVMGFVANGPQLAADRYTYLPCLCWPVLAAAALLRFGRGRTPAGKKALALTATACLGALFVLTRRQTEVWLDSERLWRYDLTIEPRSSIARTDLGMALLERGDFAEAAREFNEALKIRPLYALARMDLGVCRAGQGALSDAVADYREAIRMEPGLSEAHNNLAAALIEQGRASEAVAEFREAVRIQPEYTQAHYNLGAALSRQGGLAEAVLEFREAIKLRPDYMEAHNNLGVVLSRLGALEEAAVQYRQALALNPRYAAAQNNLGVALMNLGKLQEAVEHYHQALELDPDNAEVRGNLNLALGRIEVPGKAALGFPSIDLDRP